MTAKDINDLSTNAPRSGWACILVSGENSLEEAVEICKELKYPSLEPFEALPAVILLIKQEQLECLTKTLAKTSSELGEDSATEAEDNFGRDLTTDLFDDFCLLPTTSFEISLRLARFVSHKGTKPPEIIEYGPLSLNLDTYQAMVLDEVLDLTYMEYELLRFLASKPGRVFTRDVLLTQVWGYDYYGGARTVDVHVRRLRAKLGEEYAYLIQTVRSIGYRFGTPRWSG
jgi:hypothetical protein